MSELLATAADPGNDPGDALLLRVDSAGADPLSLALSMDAFCGHRVFKPRADGSRPPLPAFDSAPLSAPRAARGAAFDPSLRPAPRASAGTRRGVPAAHKPSKPRRVIGR
jgi:hypothetical protein